MGRLVITGGAGFIGSHLVDRARREGHDVVVLDNLITGSRDNLAQHDGDPGVDFQLHDVSRPITVEGAVDGIFHLASPASPEDYLRYPIKTLKAGSLGTHNVMGLAKAKNCPVLVASTSEVYGDPLEHPQQEGYWGNVNPVGPRSCYDEAKRFTEALTMAYHRGHGIRTRIARIFNTYGPRMGLGDGRVLPNFMCQAIRGEPITVYGDGSQTRSFCYVDDLVDGLWRLMDTDEPYPVNLGNPQEITILEFAGSVIEATGSGSEIVYRDLPADDPKRRRPDISRAKRLLEWAPTVALADGLSRTVDGFRARIDIEAAT